MVSNVYSAGREATKNQDIRLTAALTCSSRAYLQFVGDNRLLSLTLQREGLPCRLVQHKLHAAKSTLACKRQAKALRDPEEAVYTQLTVRSTT